MGLALDDIRTQFDNAKPNQKILVTHTLLTINKGSQMVNKTQILTHLAFEYTLNRNNLISILFLHAEFLEIRGPSLRRHSHSV